MRTNYKSLKQECYNANMELNALGLVIYTFGNVSAVDRENGVFAIKPSGVPYEVLKPEDIVILDFDNNIIYDIKVPMGAGFNNGWLSQITGYLVTPVTGSIGINLEEYKMWNKTGIIDITNGKLHYFEYDFSNKTKVDILVHILEIHDFQEDIINRLLDKL